ncbi:hypothetical protein [Kitasatospora purpeofusca]|uniref:hypothetical protein n=1 Tax=Kitasatospora purpeofusca TaxID=67352 RepID=UPI0004BF0F1F|nr:hypothetical protein [Kitasatospora purpeofusca]
MLVVVVLSAPAWLSWPFLSEQRQRIVIEMVKALADWTQGASPQDFPVESTVDPGGTGPAIETGADELRPPGQPRAGA